VGTTAEPFLSPFAAHAADVANGREGARDWDDALSEARYAFDWSEQFDLSARPGTRPVIPRPDAPGR